MGALLKAFLSHFCIFKHVFRPCTLECKYIELLLPGFLTYLEHSCLETQKGSALFIDSGCKVLTWKNALLSIDTACPPILGASRPFNDFNSIPHVET